MRCAIIATYKLEKTYYSGDNNFCLGESNLALMLTDLDKYLPNEIALGATVDSDGNVAIMEFIEFNGGYFDEPIPTKVLCYNTMKAYCDAYGVGLAEPEYVGPYSLEVARHASELCGDHLTIIPEDEEVEVYCES